MIRMGRSGKTETASETPKFQDNFSDNTANFYNGNQESQSYAHSFSGESDLISREIKDGRLSGFVGQGTGLKGEMTFQAMLRVDGHLTGQIVSEKGTLIVGATGKVDANVAVASAVINGIVNGDIIATEKIELGRTAQIIGNIQSPRLVMEDGAILEGSCVMIKAREVSEKRADEANARISASKPATLDMTEDFAAKKAEVA